MTEIQFFVSGEPKAQPRSRSFVLRGKGGKPILTKDGQPIIRVNDPGTAEGWKSQIAVAARPYIPFKLPLYPAENANGTMNAVYAYLMFSFQRPQAHFRTNGALKDWAPMWNTSRVDCDNLAKAVLDCLTTVGFWKDDGIVCRMDVVKRYCGIGEPSGCMVYLKLLESKTTWVQKPDMLQPALQL